MLLGAEVTEPHGIQSGEPRCCLHDLRQHGRCEARVATSHRNAQQRTGELQPATANVHDVASARAYVPDMSFTPLGQYDLEPIHGDHQSRFDPAVQRAGASR